MIAVDMGVNLHIVVKVDPESLGNDHGVEANEEKDPKKARKNKFINFSQIIFAYFSFTST